MDEKILNEALKKAKEYTLLMEYLVELKGHTLDGILVGYIDSIETNSPKIYALTLKQAREWKESGEPLLTPEDREAMEKKSTWLIMRKKDKND